MSGDDPDITDPSGSEDQTASARPLDDDNSTVKIPAEEVLDPLIGQRIGNFSIKSVIAAGGMGTVYLAQQEKPRRSVALKVMGSGIASRSAVLLRFEFESQILARLRHPNIAEVIEAGTHDDGSGGVPYFAMEYVPGAKPITQFVIDHELSTQERLELFTKVCDAVQHGHQKGIIHRDLKPANILVDADGQPKIIDFGVARATDSDMAVTTVQTDIGALIGTLQYMSPEQCDADPHALDTRSDVYALGVVLYEMLCEQLPYDLSRAAIHEAARIIREEVPPKPSTINRRLRGDVETIALKALDKDRRRRYQSAGDLGSDVERYLSREPIQARRPSLVYVLSMLARRSKGRFAVALVLVLLPVVIILTLAVVGTSLALIRSLDAEEAANGARGEAISERDRAESAIDVAITVLNKTFDELIGIDPEDLDWDIDPDDEQLEEIWKAEREKAISRMRKARELLGYYQALDRYDLALEKYEKTYRYYRHDLDPGNRIHPSVALARLYVHAEQYEKAREALAEAVKGVESRPVPKWLQDEIDRVDGLLLSDSEGAVEPES